MWIFHGYVWFAMWAFATGHSIAGGISCGFCALMILIDAFDNSPAAKLTRALRG
jgi:hypothetical protein